MIKKNFINYGITSRSIQTRYNTKKSMPYNYEIIQEIHSDTNSIWELEKYLKQYIKNKKLIYKPLIQFSGNLTECFI